MPSSLGIYGSFFFIVFRIWNGCHRNVPTVKNKAVVFHSPSMVFFFVLFSFNHKSNGFYFFVCLFCSMQKMHNEALLSLMQTLEGPQDIQLELSMTVFKDGQPAGTSVAKLFIYVSEFEF